MPSEPGNFGTGSGFVVDVVIRHGCAVPVQRSWLFDAACLMCGAESWKDFEVWTFFFDLPIIEGKPKYFPGCTFCIEPSTFLTLSLVSSLELFKKRPWFFCVYFLACLLRSLNLLSYFVWVRNHALTVTYYYIVDLI